MEKPKTPVGIFQHSHPYIISVAASFIVPGQKALEARIAALENDQAFQATQTEIQKVQASCLQQLREVREALDKDGSGGAAAQAQSEAALAEKAALERKVAKLEYRVQHLLGSMEYLYEKAKAASA